MSQPLLEVKNLKVSFHTYAGEVQAVRGVDFTLEAGKTMAIVGESGSGKTVTSKAVMGLIASPPGEVKKESSILFEGTDILKYTEKQWQDYRGKDAAMIFQDPMTSLDPTMKIGRQIMESIVEHQKVGKREAMQRAVELLKKVDIPNPDERVHQYPYEFSGGMRQRVVIAIALACNPKLMIADEPTTALDVTIQAQIIGLLKEIQKANNTSVIMITHDLGVVASLCNRIAIMYGGKIVEIGTDKEIFYEPKHPYTQGLLNCINNPEDDDKDLQPIPGSPPDLLNPPKGCPFVDRCEKAMRICKEQMPSATAFSKTHECACWLNELKKREGKK